MATDYIDVTALKNGVDSTWISGNSSTKADDVRSWVKGLIDDVADEFNNFGSDDLADSAISSPSTDQLLKFDSSGNLINFTHSFITDLSSFTTDDLAEGSANLYFTDARAVSALNGENISIFNNDKGYITDGGGLSDHSVAYSKIQEVSTQYRVLGLTSTTGPADVEEVVSALQDSSQTSLFYDANGWMEWMSSCFLSQTSPTSVSGSDFTSTIVSYIGSKGVPSNYLQTGKVLKVRQRGVISLSSGETVDVRINFANNTISTGSVFSSIVPSLQNYELEVDIVCRSTGTSGIIYMLGFLRVFDGSGNENVAQLAANDAAIDTTVSNTLDVEAKVSNTNDSITSQLTYYTKEA